MCPRVGQVPGLRESAGVFTAAAVGIRLRAKVLHRSSWAGSLTLTTHSPVHSLRPGVVFAPVGPDTRRRPSPHRARHRSSSPTGSSACSTAAPRPYSPGERPTGTGKKRPSSWSLSGSAGSNSTSAAARPRRGSKRWPGAVDDAAPVMCSTPYALVPCWPRASRAPVMDHRVRCGWPPACG